MPLPVIVFGAIKALAAVATWTTGEVVAAGAASAAGGGLLTWGIIHFIRRDLNDSPLNQKNKQIELAQADLKKDLDSQKKLAESNRLEKEFIQKKQQESDSTILLIQETSGLVDRQAQEFQNLISEINEALNSPKSSINELQKLLIDFREKSGISESGKQYFDLISKLTSKIKSLEENLCYMKEENQFYANKVEALTKADVATEPMLRNHSVFAPQKINVCAQPIISNANFAK